MKLDLNVINDLVGKAAEEKVNECLGIINSTKWPLYFIGPSGSGKTAISMAVAKAYAQEHNVPAYYLQLSPDQTKTSIILGLRLINGSLVPVKGVVAQAMEEGAIIIIDEATHTNQELLLMFNSIMDRTSITSIGDEIVYAKDTFRIIFSSNNQYYAGNVRLPQSFAQRVVTFRFDYPSFIDEVKITAKIVSDEYSGKKAIMPVSVLKYICSFIREIRSDIYPLSARNAAIAVMRLLILAKEKINEQQSKDSKEDEKPVKGGKKVIAKKGEGDDDDYFTKGQNVESIRRRIANRILGRDVQSVDELKCKDVNEFVNFVSMIGIPGFREIILSSCMFYLDVDGMEINEDSFRQKIFSSVI